MNEQRGKKVRKKVRKLTEGSRSSLRPSKLTRISSPPISYDKAEALEVSILSRLGRPLQRRVSCDFAAFRMFFFDRVLASASLLLSVHLSSAATQQSISHRKSSKVDQIVLDYCRIMQRCHWSDRLICFLASNSTLSPLSLLFLSPNYLLLLLSYPPSPT